MDDRYYFNKICKIQKHVNKVYCYLNILQIYTEIEMVDNQKIGNINEVITDCLNEVSYMYKYI